MRPRAWPSRLPSEPTRLVPLVLICGVLAIGAASCGRTRTPGELLKNPEAGESSADLARGSALYARYWSPCHGKTGLGDGRYFATALEARPTDLTRTDAATLEDARLLSWIQKGSAAFQRSNLCPSWQYTLPSQDILAVARFVRSMRKANTQKPGEKT